MATDPSVWATGIEELLRVYSPVTMARITVEDTTVGGCPVHAGDRVLLHFGAANRDPAVFPTPIPSCSTVRPTATSPSAPASTGAPAHGTAETSVSAGRRRSMTKPGNPSAATWSMRSK
jgi:hypothetical protein